MKVQHRDSTECAAIHADVIRIVLYTISIVSDHLFLLYTFFHLLSTKYRVWYDSFHLFIVEYVVCSLCILRINKSSQPNVVRLKMKSSSIITYLPLTNLNTFMLLLQFCNGCLEFLKLNYMLGNFGHQFFNCGLLSFKYGWLFFF